MLPRESPPRLFAEVAVDAPRSRASTFTYSLPEGLQARPGHGVTVPFGRQVRQGIVVALNDRTDVPNVRAVQDLIDPDPLVSPLHLELARWISAHYLCSLYEALEPMLPPAFDRGQVVSFALGDGDTSGKVFTPLRRRALDLLSQHGPLTAATLKESLGARAVQGMAALERAGIVIREVSLGRPRVAPHYEAWIDLAVPTDEAAEQARRLRGSGAFRQADALETLIRAGVSASLAEARRVSGAGTEAWEALVQRGLIRISTWETRRDPLAAWSGHKTAPPEPTPHQRAASAEIASALESGKGGVFLLHGVTGSGKTEVYLEALQRTVSLGKRGIVLVPEIALTPQTIERFWARFPGRVAVLHSGLSLREQYDEWRSIREGRFDVVIGSRRAVLAPQPDLGLIVVDEEQEWTYKQEERAPRYHARDVAVELSRLGQVVTVLGSATPDVGTMFKALSGAYGLVELPGRITTGISGVGWVDRPLADVQVVDLREELLSGNRGIFSRTLKEAVGAALAAGEQAILFVNRRGAGSAVQCRSCGYAVGCTRCSVALTYHAEGALVCHHCGRRRANPDRCPACGRRTIRALGVGTERVVEEAARDFPMARVLRWDRDAVLSSGGHEAILGAFMRREADILVGTQMLAKGLDLPNVTVVGVVSADIGLHLPDLRAGERAFQVLCQVSGRAGRGFAPGRVIIQTYEPSHYAVRNAAAQDYRQFYLEEIGFRAAQGYPPLARMVRLVHTNTSSGSARLQAERFAAALASEIRRLGLSGTRLIGPAPAPLERLRGRYRWQLEILGPDPAAVLHHVSVPLGWTVDVDPVTFM